MIVPISTLSLSLSFFSLLFLSARPVVEKIGRQAPDVCSSFEYQSELDYVQHGASSEPDTEHNHIVAAWD